MLCADLPTINCVGHQALPRKIIIPGVSWVRRVEKLLIDDEGINCAVIKLDNDHFGHIDIDKQVVTVGAGMSLYNTIQSTIKAGLSGMEVLVGIPGTIGGAIKMNAGGRFGDIGTQTSRVEVIDVSGTTPGGKDPN